jgi:hypothetical protein
MTDFGSLMRDVAPLLGYDPGRADRRGVARYRARGSLRIDYARGLFADYEAGEFGGVYDFIKRETGESPVSWLKRNHLEAPERCAARAARRRTEDLGAERRDLTQEEQERIQLAQKIWDAGAPVDDVAAVRGYFASRCLELGDTSQFRFLAQTPWSPPDEPFRACLLVAYRNLDDDAVTGLSRILVDEPERWPKTRRMMLGVVRRAAVKLAPVADKLAVGEGVETAMAANQMGHGPAWALGSAGAIANLPVLPNIHHLILLAENNDDGASRTATERCGQRWLRAGRHVTRVWPDAGCGDLNDELISKEEISHGE